MTQIGQSGHNADDAAPAGTDDHHRPWYKRPLPWIGALATAVVTGVAITLASSYANNAVSGDNHALAPTGLPATGGQAARLQVDKVSLTYGNDKTSDLAPFKIDIKLLNAGSQVAIVNHVRLIVQQFAALPRCAAQGNFTSTGAYSANMPTTALPGQVIDVPISQLVPAGGADRFDVLLETRILQGFPQKFTVYLYRVHAYLTYNVGTRPVDLGEILVVLPFPPESGEYFWSRYYAANPQVVSGVVTPPEIPAYKRCAIRNSNVLHSILALPAMRTPELAAIPARLAH
jgi:hypothetical protein